MDYKLYTSIISKRIEHFLPDLIDEDQTGFIKGRQGRLTLPIIDHIQKQEVHALLVSLDAEKVFDCVHWNFFYQVLEKFGFKTQAIQCIKTLYQGLKLMVI